MHRAAPASEALSNICGTCRGRYLGVGCWYHGQRLLVGLSTLGRIGERDPDTGDISSSPNSHAEAVIVVTSLKIPAILIGTAPARLMTLYIHRNRDVLADQTDKGECGCTNIHSAPSQTPSHQVRRSSQASPFARPSTRLTS